jgi:hypothetical protein
VVAQSGLTNTGIGAFKESFHHAHQQNQRTREIKKHLFSHALELETNYENGAKIFPKSSVEYAFIG